MPVVGAIIGVGSAIYQGRQAKKAGEAVADSTDAATAEQRRQFDLVRSDTAPYRAIGTQAVNALGSMYGYTPYQEPAQVAPPMTAPQGFTRTGFSIPGMGGSQFIMRGGQDMPNRGFNEGMPPGTSGMFDPSGKMSISGGPQSPGSQTGVDYSAFIASPDYNFRREEGMRGIENSFAARGGAASGNALRALAEFNSGLASGEFGNYFNRQASLAGIGQTAVGQSGSAGMQTGANIGNALIAGGNARASGIVGQSNALSGGLANALNAWQYFRGGGYPGYGGGQWGSPPYGGRTPPFSTPPYWGG